MAHGEWIQNVRKVQGTSHLDHTKEKSIRWGRGEKEKKEKKIKGEKKKKGEKERT